MIDHVSFAVQDFQKSVQFYDQTLQELGYERIVTLLDMQIAGYGAQGKPSFWISGHGADQEHIGAARGLHIAFVAPDIASVHAWYQRCLELGGTDNGAPGPRPHYHPGYYGSFIIDPNGWRIEVALHTYHN